MPTVDTNLNIFNAVSLGRRVSFSKQWVSTHTWNRLYQKMRNEGHVATFAASLSDFETSETSPASSGLIQQESLLIDAFIFGDTVQPLPIIRLFNNKEIAEPASGPYSLELYNANDELTYSRSFDASEIHDAGEEPLFLPADRR